MTWKTAAAVVLAATVAIGSTVRAQQAPAAGGQDHVAALKESLQQGLAKIRQYEWIETTAISLKGEEKAQKHNRCSYGADGKVQKVSLDKEQPPQEQGGGGRAGRGGRLKEKVVENKKEDIQEYMQKAAALIHAYVPPDPAKIQAAKDAGRVKATPQGGAVSVVISQYLQPGDSLTITLDPKANTLTGLAVNSYLEKAEDAVTLDVRMATLPDGALYAAQTTLDVKAKNIRVVTTNSGHKPVK
jgi:hypothetical protein